MKIDRENKVYTIAFTFIITFAFVIVLSLINNATEPTVKKNQELLKVKAILNAMDISYLSDDEALDKFRNDVQKVENDKYEIYKTTSGGEEIYALIFSGSGLWGTITGVLAVDSSLSTIKGIDFISQSETPGLGGRIEENWFKDQFRDEKVADGMVSVSVTKTDGSKEDGKVDAVTGATLTSKSVEKIVNDSLVRLREVLGVK
ncbi:MAG TPA: FMN-binding protein [Fervidobacterium sp.]|jgi:Na+-transporting NADH:ubiquinone oxidoreductase subunit C|nr:FMN-binding protein [Fervidobacterium sp.]MBP8656775.1 FMN-binding protein [Fervidobacterium sp.]MBP9518327.1 FMN-binding protein [Fervidobacterium sp.]HOH53763.1 FMN-binding protein [Fervidobacterium sp.]HOP81756.1 FMN-binding protein [Fervidobacterium sp.]